MTLLDVVKRFYTNDKCLKYIENIRWSDSITCPRCNSDKISKIYTRNRYECSKCKYQYNATSGTILAKTYLPLSRWFLVIYLFCDSGGKISASEIARILRLPYKTAWFMHHKVKNASRNYDFEQLGGIIKEGGDKNVKPSKKQRAV